MHAPLKNKGSKKTKDRKKPVSLEDKIPEVPQLSDFQSTNSLFSTSPKNETGDFKIHDLASAAQELDDEKIQNEEEKEEENFLETDVMTKNEKKSSSLMNVENNFKFSDLKNVICQENEMNNEDVYQNRVVENKDALKTLDELKLDNLKITNIENQKKSDSAVHNYLHLSTTVEKCFNEINEPSVPKVEGEVIIVPVLSEENLQTEGKKIIEEKPVDISAYKFTMVVEDFLPPFTDEKLSDFYYNSELQEMKEYVNEFISQEVNNINSGTKSSHELYKLLVEYLQSKNLLKAHEAKVEKLKERIAICTSTMWNVWNDVQVMEKEKCTDGNVVSFVDTHTLTQFNLNVFQEYSSLINQLKNLIYESFMIDSFNCSLLRLKIEYYLQCLLTSCSEFTNLEEKFPAVLYSFSLNSHFRQCLSDLRMAISVLFFFQRKQTLDVDNSFLLETRQWISDLVSIFLRVGDWKDHIFLLSHIMRCPGGVSEWATPFVQLPLTKVSGDSELNHMITVMSILLSPVEQRENFIKKWESELATEVNPWTVIDSDGEVEDDEQDFCPLKENDLVSLLNQIPFAHMFKMILKYDNGTISNGTITFDFLLRLFSFFTEVIKILLSGLKLYSTQRYRQFTKRLGRLIYHVVRYATDAVIIYKSQNVPESEILRIQIEYDNFFLRSTKFIYSAKKHGAWQFLATVPYHLASPNAILKLYGILQLNDDQEDHVVKINFTTFEEKFLQLPEEEQFYLLTTFANMALARDVVEIQFIKNILLQLFYIGFLSTATMDHCYKNVKSLLCSICSVYPFLMSEILFIQKNMFLTKPNHNQSLTTYLWLKLPVDVWCPDKRDFDTLSSWLFEPIQSVQNGLARIILQSLNYGVIQGNLFIPLENHRLIAMMILQSNVKLITENETGMMKNVSNLVRSQTPEQIMNDWTWNIILKLRLHLLDQSDAEIYKCLHNLTDYLKNIPDVESNVELHQLVIKKHPLGCFIALMTTTLGHSVPIIFDKGFELVEVLLNAGKYEASVACLEYMTLLFVDCSDSLYKCEKFIFLLSRLFAADNSYVEFAKNLISSNFPGPVLKCIESMLQNQLNLCRSLNLKKFSSVIQLWLFSLTKLPLWMQEPGILYLFDKLLKNAFFDGTSAKLVTAVLEDLLEANSPQSETKSSFSSLVSWINSKVNPPSLLLKGFNGEVPWFAYKIIQLEFEIYEKKSSVWVELLKELYSSSDKKTNVDNSLKKVCNQLRIPVRPSSALAFYKWSNQILETDFCHPLTPLLWQRFFFLYLYRIPALVDKGSIGLKFFDGVINQGLYKRLKLRLEETQKYYKTLSEQTQDTEYDYYLRCQKLFQTFSLWLNDPRLHEPCLSIHMLPIQYNPELLGLLIHGSETPWIEYLEYQNIEKSFREGSMAWFKVKNRCVNTKEKRVVSHKKEKALLDELNERLNSYEIPLPPPKIDAKKYGLTRVNVDTLTNADRMIMFIQPFVKELLDYMQYYIQCLNENVSLGCDLQDLFPRLYLTTETRKVLKKHCNGVGKTINGKTVHYTCSGPAIVQLTFEESRVNEEVKQHLEQCEKLFANNIQNALLLLPHKIIKSAVLIDAAIQELRKEYAIAKVRENDGKMTEKLKGTGVHLFYELVRTLCEKVDQIPPLKKAFENYIEALGKTFVENNAEENDRILHLILDDDMFGEKICKYFTPNASSSFDFIENYSKALKCASKRRFLILSKFDLPLWLAKNKPKFSERSKMISGVCQGLKFLNGSLEDKSVIKLLNEHLEVLLIYDFPEHYGEVLNFLIEASESQTLPTSSWFMFLNALAFGHTSIVGGQTDQNFFEPGQPVKKLKYYFSKFATDQNVIPFEVIKGTISLLASTFKAERIKAGAYGLYKKYKLYVEPLFIFFGMLSYSCVAKALEIDTGSLSDKIAQHLWPLFNDLYSPWLIPYCVDLDKLQSVQWSQEDNFERCVLLPWSMNDSYQASFCASIFSESVRFLFDALPGVNHVLSYAWYFYVTNFAHVYVKDFVLNVVHDNLANLPWESFVPGLQDVELMLRVVDQFLPISHTFLGNIFVNIKWTELVQYYLEYCDAETTSKFHICLLHLLVKLPLEPSLKQNDKVITLLVEANNYAWHLVDSTSYDVVLNWFVMSCDPRIILMDERLEYYKLDSKILRLLQVCAGYVPSAKLFHSTTVTKRLMFVRACVKWLITSNRRFKSARSPLFKSALQTIWISLETVLNETVPSHQRVDEAAILLSEFLSILTEPEICSLVETTFTEWLSSRKSQVIVLGLLRSAGISIENVNTFGHVMETALESYFSDSENCDWTEVSNILVSFSKSKSDAQLEKVLSDNNYFLTLHAILLKKVNRNDTGFSSKLILIDLLQLLSDVKPSVALEPKLILLISLSLKLAENEIKFNIKEGISYLIKLSDILNSFINDKGNGFLSTIGLKKSPFSNRFKLVCLIAYGGITMFLKNNYPEYQEHMDDKVLYALESADNNKAYQNIQQYAAYAKTAIKEMSTIEQIINFLKHIGLRLFNKLYLK